MTYRPWNPGECCGVCGKAGDAKYFDGGLIACSETVKWVCSSACFDVVHPPHIIELDRRRAKLNDLLFSDDKDELLGAIREVTPIADAESITRLARLASNRIGYIQEIQDAAEAALKRIAGK